MATRYYCCGSCGHVISSPAWPHECEHCHADDGALLQYRGFDEAELRSQLILDGGRYGGDDDTAGSPNHNLRVVVGWELG